MNIDDRIKQELESEAEEIDQILNEKQGMLEMASGVFKSGLRRWVFIVGVCTLIVSGFMVWAAYEFFMATNIDERVFAGVCLVVTLCMQVALKQWTWMEMNRTSLLREIKRLEISVVKLSSKLDRENNAAES